jgi:hypothetical protein
VTETCAALLVAARQAPLSLSTRSLGVDHQQHFSSTRLFQTICLHALGKPVFLVSYRPWYYTARAAALGSRGSGHENSFRKNWWRGCLVSQLLDYKFRNRSCTKGGKYLETLS